MNKALSFLNLLDRSKKLSLTNLALYVLIVKIALVPQLSVADGAVLFLGILNYMHKRFEANKSSKIEATEQSEVVAKLRKEMEEQLSVVRDEIGKVSVASGIFKR
jgi:hypothetical protein